MWGVVRPPPRLGLPLSVLCAGTLQVGGQDLSASLCVGTHHARAQTATEGCAVPHGQAGRLPGAQQGHCAAGHPTKPRGRGAFSLVWAQRRGQVWCRGVSWKQKGAQPLLIPTATPGPTHHCSNTVHPLQPATVPVGGAGECTGGGREGARGRGKPRRRGGGAGGGSRAKGLTPCSCLGPQPPRA